MSAGSATTDWYYTKPDSQAGQPIGPLTWQQLYSLARAGVLAPADMVWNASLPQWLPAGQVTGLFQEAQPSGAQAQTPAPPAGQGGVYYQPSSQPPAQMPPGAYGPRPRRGWVLPLVISLVVVVLVGGGLGAYFGFIRDTDKTVTDSTGASLGGRTTTTVSGSSATSTSATPSTTARPTTSTSTTTTVVASGAWANLQPSGDLPADRMGHAMVYELATKNVILFGGVFKGADDLTTYGDTLMYDPVTNVWTNLDLAPAPSARDSHAMAYDENDGQVILFGGWGADNIYLNDTWTYDPLTFAWIDLEPEGDAPSPRYSPTLVYDPESGASILFGGTDDGDTGLNDTWSYDRATNAWTDLDPSGALPPGRFGHSAVYDPDTGSMILFGGWVDGGPANDMWAYDPAANTWTELKPTGDVPAPRDSQAVVYDSATKQVILFGGWGEGAFLSDTWAYDPEGNKWTELKPAGDVPLPRALAAMVFDSASGMAILFGGYDRESHFADTWSWGL